MRFKEVQYSALRLAWKFQKMQIDRAKNKHNVKWFSLWNVAFAVALPIGAVVMSIREKQFLEDNHDAIVNCIERYWESTEVNNA